MISASQSGITLPGELDSNHLDIIFSNTLTPINPTVPGFPDVQTEAFGINNNGNIVSYLAIQHVGYLDSAGAFSVVDVPVTNSYTVPDGINDNSTIVGYYDDASGVHGFILNPQGVSQIAPIIGSATVGPSFAFSNVP